MPNTVYDHITNIFPHSTNPNPEIAYESDSDPRRWEKCPIIPTDLFAVSARLLDISSAYSFFDPDPEGVSDDSEEPWFCLSKSERRKCQSLGKKWIKLHASLKSAATPDKVQQLWDALLEHGSEPIRKSMRNTPAPDWWKIALQLLIVSDEACERIGRPEAEDDPWFKKMIDHRNIRRGQSTMSNAPRISDGPGVRRADGSRATLAFMANQNVVNVFPKSRLSISGCSHRNFSRHLTILPQIGSSRCHWHLPSQPLRADDDMPVDILIIPFPFHVRAKSFRPSHNARDSMKGGSRSKHRPYWGNFRLEQDWLDDTDIVELSARLMISAKRDVQTVNVVMFPEYAMDFATFEKVCSALKRIEPGLEFVISGTSDNCDPDVDGDGNFAMTAVWHDFGQGARAVISSRKKHHRWMLSSTQLESYALTSTLDPRVNWWETHNIGQRELHFHPFRKSSLFSAMICEDLARSEPCHEVLRSVAPNLVFVLLMDGPQLHHRWSARYASMLSDDPGCSVLTLTCFGLVERSNQTRMFDRQEAVAFFSSPFGQTPIYLPYHEGARGVLLTLTSVAERNQQTIDGRINKDSRAWKLTSTQPVLPVSATTHPTAGMFVRPDSSRKSMNLRAARARRR